MRKINSIVTIILILLFLDHGIFGILNTLGVAKVFLPVARVLRIFLLIHVIISIILTIRSEKVSFKTKAVYNKENKEYWMRRWTGLFIFVFFIAHMRTMKAGADGTAKLASTSTFGKISFILFVASIAAHLAINFRPLMISLGVKNHKVITRVLNIIYIAICVIAAIACIYTMIGGGK